MERPRWRDPLLEWRLSEIERRIQHRFRTIVAESRSARNPTTQAQRLVQLPRASWEPTNEDDQHSHRPIHTMSYETAAATFVAEIEKQIENEIIEDRLRNSDAIEWTLSPRSARNIKALGSVNFQNSDDLYDFTTDVFVQLFN